MGRFVKGVLAIVVLATLGVLLTWAFLEGRAERQREMERELPVAPPPRVTKGASGELLIKFDRETQERIGLKTKSLVAAEHQPQVVAYGSLEGSPTQIFTLRVPVPGTIEPEPEHGWPVLGATLEDGASIGSIRPRLGAVERVDLTTRLRTQQSQVVEIQASLAAARSSYESKKRLNERNQIVTERTLEEAEAKVKAEEARLTAAIDTVTLIEKALSGGSSGELWPLTVPRGGQVVQVAIQPGELVEAGQTILQLQRFDELIARVGLPRSASLQRSPRLARIEVIGQESALLDAELVGPSPSLESKTLGQSLLYRVRLTESQLRPGAAVKTYIPVEGKTLTGVVVPTEAIERYLGKSWVYVQVGDDTFVRREVSASFPAAEGWFVKNGFVAGDRVVTSGSQTLLSEEFKSQIQSFGEGEGQ